MPAITSRQSNALDIGSEPEAVTPDSRDEGAAADRAGPAGECIASKESIASRGRLGAADTILANCGGGGPTGIVTVTKRISTGIDSEASSTTVHAVICACGFRTRKASGRAK